MLGVICGKTTNEKKDIQKSKGRTDNEQFSYFLKPKHPDTLIRTGVLS